MPNAYAIVKVRVSCASSWSPETTIEQVTRQAKVDATAQINNAINDRRDMSVVGEPVITAVHTLLKEGGS